MSWLYLVMVSLVWGCTTPLATSSNGVGMLYIFTSCRHYGVKCSVAWHVVLSTRLLSAFWEMNAVLRGVCYNAWQAVGGVIEVLFLVVCWWTYWVACTTIGEVKLVALVALPATLGAGLVVAIRLAILGDRRSLTLCGGLSVIMVVRSAIVVACWLLSVAVLGVVYLRDSISFVAAIIVLSCSEMVGTLHFMGITVYVPVFW